MFGLSVPKPGNAPANSGLSSHQPVRPAAPNKMQSNAMARANGINAGGGPGCTAIVAVMAVGALRM